MTTIQTQVPSATKLTLADLTAEQQATTLKVVTASKAFAKASATLIGSVRTFITEVANDKDLVIDYEFSVEFPGMDAKVLREMAAEARSDIATKVTPDATGKKAWAIIGRIRKAWTHATTELKAEASRAAMTEEETEEQAEQAAAEQTFKAFEGAKKKLEKLDPLAQAALRTRLTAIGVTV